MLARPRHPESTMGARMWATTHLTEPPWRGPNSRRLRAGRRVFGGVFAPLDHLLPCPLGPDCQQGPLSTPPAGLARQVKHRLMHRRHCARGPLPSVPTKQTWGRR